MNCGGTGCEPAIPALTDNDVCVTAACESVIEALAAHAGSVPGDAATLAALRTLLAAVAAPERPPQRALIRAMAPPSRPRL